MYGKQYSSILTQLFKVKVNQLVELRKQSVEKLFEMRRTFFYAHFTNANRENTKVAKFIHVAGTKGKGSTVEYIAAGLRKQHRVGVFTSPHLHSARERLKVNLNIISKQDFIRHGNLALSLANDELQKKEQPDWFVFFDYLMLMAINYFSEQNLDYIVLETGTS